MSSSKVSCCIRGCSNMPYKNKNQNSRVKFYRFPASTLNSEWIIHKRERWINAVKNYVKYPTDWEPTKNTRICSAHFINNQKSEHPRHPSYTPTIFPGKVNIKNSTQSVERFERLRQRNLRSEMNIFNNKNNNNNNSNNNISEIEIEDDNNWIDVETQSVEDHCAFDDTPKKTTLSITCQTDEIVDDIVLDEHKYFFCNINSCDGVSTAEVQVNIPIKRTAEKICYVNLPPLQKNVEDVGCDPIAPDSIKSDCPGFHGITSIHDDQSLSSLTGVNFSIFALLLNMLPDIKSTKIDKKTKLLITLTKLKTGLTFTALGILFSIHRTSAQKIFIRNLQQLNILLKNFIVWPSRATIQATLPEAFKKNYPATRVIIDCTEVYTEQPPEVRQKVLMYSDYKHHQTVKFLVGCAPNGLITFVSKCYGGRSSDCYITNDCGILDLIEPGDVVLADKGFPQIQTEVEKKNAIFIMPPFAHDGQFTAEEVNKTYNIASVRIHIERVNQRIKDFNIFTKIPISLLPHVDEIVFCNLQFNKYFLPYNKTII